MKWFAVLICTLFVAVFSASDAKADWQYCVENSSAICDVLGVEIYINCGGGPVLHTIIPIVPMLGGIVCVDIPDDCYVEGIRYQGNWYPVFTMPHAVAPGPPQWVGVQPGGARFWD